MTMRLLADANRSPNPGFASRGTCNVGSQNILNEDEELKCGRLQLTLVKPTCWRSSRRPSVGLTEADDGQECGHEPTVTTVGLPASWLTCSGRCGARLPPSRERSTADH
jgi:hypothetical protein